jgi:hypothetical protein
VCTKEHYRLNGACAPCPSYAVVAIVLFFVALLLLVVVSMELNRRKVNLSGLGIGVDFMQVLTLVSSFKFQWPPIIVMMFNVMSASSANIEITAPECSVKWTFVQKWVILFSLPLLVVTISSLGVLIVSLRTCATKGCRGWSAQKTVINAMDAALGTGFTAVYFLYFVVVRNSLSLFACTTNTNGASVLEADPSISCSDPTSVRYSLLGLGWVSIWLYMLGTPAVFGLVIWRYRVRMRADQILKADGTGETAANPNYVLRKRYRKIYEQFTPEFIYWRIILVSRKAVMCATALLFDGQAMFQVRARVRSWQSAHRGCRFVCTGVMHSWFVLCCAQGSTAVAILFVAYVMHTNANPYLARRPVSEKFARHLKDMATKYGLNNDELAKRSFREVLSDTWEMSVRRRLGAGPSTSPPSATTTLEARRKSSSMRRASVAEVVSLIKRDPALTMGAALNFVFDYNRCERLVMYWT